MVYTITELKSVLDGKPLKEIAEHTGIHHTTLWRLWKGQQEAREGTLVKLTEFVQGRG